jgi:tetratricopeptide (TPR) repeat protein
MTADEHFDEETLIALAEDRADQDTHPHLIECAECGETFREYRTLLDTFAEGATWDAPVLDETPNPQTIANPRGFVEQMQREDAEAEPLVAELLAGQREGWMPRLMADEKYRTAGVVRTLIAATDAAAEESPKDYVEIAKLAVEIAESFTAGENESELLQLRASVYRERSYSLYLRGEIDSALTWAQRAVATLEATPSSAYEMGRTHMLLATLNWRLNHLDEAERLCQRAEQFFNEAGDFRRHVNASILRATVTAERHDLMGALGITSRILDTFDSKLDDDTRAALRCNQGGYLRDLGRVVEAIENFKEAGFILSSLGSRSSFVRVQFNEAILLQQVGDHGSATDRFVHVIDEFEQLGMRSTATLAALYLAESRLEQGRFDDVEMLCAYAMNLVRDSPDAYQQRTLLALGLLRSASAERRVSRRLVHRVRRVVERLEFHTVETFAERPTPLP